MRIRRRSIRSAACAAAIVFVAAAAAACGGSGGDEAADSLESRAETLQACLNDAGLQASPRETTPVGVDVPVFGVTVDGLTTADSAQVWLFESASEAADGRVAITLATEDTPRSRLAGRAVVRYNNMPSDTERATVDGCLVAPVT